MDIVAGIAGFAVLLLLGFGPWLYRWLAQGLRERGLVKDREEWYAAVQRGETRYSYEQWRNRREG